MQTKNPRPRLERLSRRRGLESWSRLRPKAGYPTAGRRGTRTSMYWAAVSRRSASTAAAAAHLARAPLAPPKRNSIPPRIRTVTPLDPMSATASISRRRGRGAVGGTAAQAVDAHVPHGDERGIAKPGEVADGEDDRAEHGHLRPQELPGPLPSSTPPWPRPSAGGGTPRRRGAPRRRLAHG